VGGGVMEIFALVGVIIIFGALWHDFRAWLRRR
jgi:hypothetical protein